MKGKFIVFEGGEGTGKTTVVSAVVEALQDFRNFSLPLSARKVIAVRDPGGTPSSAEIRKLLVEGETGRWAPLTELFLFSAARNELVEKVIAPALDAGTTVICDRFIDSTRVYQTRESRLSLETVDSTIDLALSPTGIYPDFFILLDGDVDTLMARAKSRGGVETRFENMDLSIHREIRRKFLQFFYEKPEGTMAVVDATQPIDVVIRQCVSAIMKNVFHVDQETA